MTKHLHNFQPLRTSCQVVRHRLIVDTVEYVYESFQDACGQLMDKFRSVIPEGYLRARIRATNRESREPIEGELGETLGEEAIGMVVVDSAGHPMKYDALNVFSDVVATY